MSASLKHFGTTEAQIAPSAALKVSAGCLYWLHVRNTLGVKCLGGYCLRTNHRPGLSAFSGCLNVYAQSSPSCNGWMLHNRCPLGKPMTGSLGNHYIHQIQVPSPYQPATQLHDQQLNCTISRSNMLMVLVYTSTIMMTLHAYVHTYVCVMSRQNYVFKQHASLVLLHCTVLNTTRIPNP